MEGQRKGKCLEKAAEELCWAAALVGSATFTESEMKHTALHCTGT